MNVRCLGLVVVVYIMTCLSARPAIAEEREKLLSEPGVFANFSAFQLDHDWWSMDRTDRLTAIAEAKVKRKLYHSSGLDDVDFITYFETSKIDDFHQLIVALEKVKENKHNRRFGHPTLIGAVKSQDEVLEILGR